MIVSIQEILYPSKDFNIRLDGYVYINNNPVQIISNTISSTGFDQIGGRCFNAATAYGVITQIRFITTGGNSTVASTYTYDDGTKIHQHTASWMNMPYSGTWTGIEAQTSDGTVCASMSLSTPFASGDLLGAYFRWTLSGSGFPTGQDYLQRLGALFLDKSGVFSNKDYFHHISYRESGAEVLRAEASYEKLTNNKHRLYWTPTADDTYDAVRIYDKASGGYYCYEKTFGTTRYMLNGLLEAIDITLV